MFLQGDMRFSASETYKEVIPRHADTLVQHIVQTPFTYLEGRAYIMEVIAYFHPFIFHQPGADFVEIRIAASASHKRGKL